MPYGTFTDRMLAVIEPYVSGKIVHDLGAGDGALAAALLRSGAAGVEAVDKTYRSGRIQLPSGGRYHQMDFQDYQPETIDVAFISWPENDRFTAKNLLPLLQRASTVIYLGKNTDGVMCGRPEIFDHFSGRQLLAYEPHKLNVLCIYGRMLKKRRSGKRLRQEEEAGLAMGFPGDPHIDYTDT